MKSNKDTLEKVIWILLWMEIIFMMICLIRGIQYKAYDDGNTPIEIKYGDNNSPYAGVIAAIQIKPSAYIDDRLDYESIVSEPQNDELPDYFEYLCQCVEAEAGDQDYLGKCYVVDCILNRVDSDEFPDNVVDVINEKHYKNGEWHWQFEVVKNDNINRVKVSDETRRAVIEELTGERKNYEMLFFCMWEFDWAEFMFQHGDHYFHK